MKKHYTTTKAGFICKSLLWSLLLYGCATCICNWQEVSGKLYDKTEHPIVYSSSTQDITPVRISLDSLQKRIRIADGVWQQLRVLLHQ